MENRKSSFKKAILITFIVSLFSLISIGVLEEYILSPAGTGRWMIVSGFIEGDFLVLGMFLIVSMLKPSIFGILMIIGLFIGFYFGLKKGSKSIFIFPIIILIISVPTTFFLMGFLGAFSSPAAPGGIATLLGLYFIVFLIFTSTASIFIYNDKEKLFFKIAKRAIIFIVVVILLGGIYFSNKFSSRREQFESKLALLKEEAIREGDSSKCEEIKKVLDGEKFESKGGIKDSLDGKYYFKPCVKEVVIKTGDVSVCDALPQPKCHVWSVEIYYTKADCITDFALYKDDSNLCELIVDNDCRNSCHNKF